MIDFGEQKFTENTPVQDFNGDKILILPSEIILYKEPVLMTAKEILNEFGTNDTNVKFYKAHSYHYSREEWEALNGTIKSKDINEIVF